jgi:hypothetical protein
MLSFPVLVQDDLPVVIQVYGSIKKTGEILTPRQAVITGRKDKKVRKYYSDYRLSPHPHTLTPIENIGFAILHYMPLH